MTIELKPCPFCGGKPVFAPTSTGREGITRYFHFDIKCESCNIFAPSHGTAWEVSFMITSDGEIKFTKDDRNAAINAWNRRAHNDD